MSLWTTSFKGKSPPLKLISTFANQILLGVVMKIAACWDYDLYIFKKEDIKEKGGILVHEWVHLMGYLKHEKKTLQKFISAII